MKRMRAILCGVLAALVLAGCGGVEQVACGSERPNPAVDLTQYAVREAIYPVYPKQPRLEDYTDENGMGGDWDAYLADFEAWGEELQALGMNVEPESGAVLDFAGRTAGEIFAGQENTVYSPISLYAALGMLTELTDGQTRQQVMDLLGAADTEALRQQIKDLWLSVYRDDDAVCRLANAAFAQEDADVKQAAVDTLAEWYFASSYRVPMGSTEADEAIAGWLNQQTGGLLSEAGNIRTDTDDLLRLYNTIYYKAGWRAAFEGGQTKADTFTAADGSEQRADFMHQTETSCVLRGEGYTAAPKRMRCGRMVFVLPDEGVTPESLLTREGFLAELTGEYDSARAVWSVPKFDVESSVDLKAILKALGVTDAFDANMADFTPLTDSGAVVSSVMQAARVRIDEEGVEAAAYTEIVVAPTAAEEPPPVVEMDLDRPFLFVIFSDANVPLFVGTVQTIV